jgi:predicted acetyltransferase
MQLVDPSMDYAESFREGILEFQDSHIPGFLNDGQPLTDAAAYIEKTKLQAKGKNIPEGWVPSNTYWLVDNDAYIGHVNIRHRLTPTLEKRGGHIGYAVRPSKQKQGYGTILVQLALEKAKELGIRKVLITCNKYNIPSCRVIEKNGGKFWDEIDVDGEPVLRFCIEN